MRDAHEPRVRYSMVRAGVRWLVCRPRGKDSCTPLPVVQEFMWRGPLRMDLLDCNLDQGQPDFLRRMGMPHQVGFHDTDAVVTAKTAPGATTCALVRRSHGGDLCRIARE